jgi:subtilisin family serine protease
VLAAELPRESRTWCPSRSMRTALRITIVIALASITTGVGAAAGSTTPRPRARVDLAVAELLARTPRGERARVIVRVREGAANRLRNALRAHGDAIRAEHESLGAFSLDLHAEDVAALVENGDVLSVSTDAVVRSNGLLGGAVGGLVNAVGGLLDAVGQVLNPDMSPSPAPAVRPKALRETLGVSGPWTGEGVGVAVIDSGVEASTEFGSRLTAFYDFTRGGVAASPSDAYGHGTHVAGTIAQSGRRSSSTTQWRGIASGARIVALKVLDAQGAGLTSDVIQAIDFAVDHRESLGIDIINLSLGHPIFEPAAVDPMVQAVERAARAGVIVVAAAGNSAATRRPVCLATPASRRPATRRRRSPSARSRARLRSNEATIGLRGTARAGRRGTTRTSSRTSSRPDTASWPRRRRTARSTGTARKFETRATATTCRSAARAWRARSRAASSR